MGNAIALSIVLDYEVGREQPGIGLALAAVAGTPITGNVVVKVDRKIKAAQLGGGSDGVQLWVQGKERTQGLTGATKQNERNLIAVWLTLKKFEGRDIKAGTYICPFQIELPAHLPETMSFRSDYMGTCSISYKMKARLGAVITERHFQVTVPPIEDKRVPCFLEPKTQPIKAMGIQKVGYVSFGASVLDTEVGRGQQIQLSIACKNRSSVDLELSVKLVELISFAASTADGHATRNHKISLGEDHLDTSRLPNLAKQSAGVVKRTLKSKGVLRQESYNEMNDSLHSTSQTIDIKVPEGARVSYKGTLIDVSHYLKIKLLTQKMIDNIEFKIPIFIGRPPDGDEPERPSGTAPPSLLEARAQSVRASQLIPVGGPDALPLASFITAVPVPDDVQEATGVMEAQAVVLGGASIETDIGASLAIEELVVLPPPEVPSFEVLLEEMLISVQDYDLLEAKLTDETWRSEVLSALTADEFGNVIAHVNRDLDQPRVAALLAPVISQFTCLYCVAALQNMAAWNKPAMVTALKPFCNDFGTNQDQIWHELSQWERVVVEGQHA